MSGTRERPGRADASKPTDTGKDWNNGFFPENESQKIDGEEDDSNFECSCNSDF